MGQASFLISDHKVLCDDYDSAPQQDQGMDELEVFVFSDADMAALCASDPIARNWFGHRVPAFVN